MLILRCFHMLTLPLLLPISALLIRRADADDAAADACCADAFAMRRVDAAAYCLRA